MIEQLVKMSNEYGKNPAYVLAGGGNTSCKDENVMYIKDSGTQLATITKDGFVGMDRKKLQEMFEKEYPGTDEQREAAVLEDMMAAKLPGYEDKRPSVEVALHHIIDYKFVLHIHPTYVNGLTCGRDGKKIADELLGDEYIWIPICKPGYTLSQLCKNELDAFKGKKGKACQVILLQNHGIFFGADDLDAMKSLVSDVMSKLESVKKFDVRTDELKGDEKNVKEFSEKIKEAMGEKEICFMLNPDIEDLVSSKAAFAPLEKPFTPDHIVYCKAKFLFTDGKDLKADIEAFKKQNGYDPKIIALEKIGVFGVGDSAKDITNIKNLFLDAVKVSVYAKNFGGYLPMTDELVDFICNWEIESYRSKVAKG